MIVNIATESIYAAQLAELQQLYSQHAGDLVVIGIPSNSFGNEPRSSQELVNYLSANYGVSFPVAAAMNVADSSGQVHELYRWLTLKSSNAVIDTKVKGDFQKYLINRQGKIVAYFTGSTSVTNQFFQNALTIHQ